MVGMRAVVGVVVHSRICKRVGLITAAALSAVDMKPEYGRRADSRRGRQTVNFGSDDSSCVGLVKTNHTADAWIITASVYAGNGVWGFAKYRMQVQKSIFRQ